MDKQNKMVIHFEKYKKQDIQRLARHNLRMNTFYRNENIDLSESDKNIYFIRPEDNNLKRAVLTEVDERVTGRITKQSTYMTECIISAGKSFFEGLDEAEEIRFFKLSLDYLAQRFGRDNIKLAVVHRDEKGNTGEQSVKGGQSHMHVDIIPIVDGRLTAKEVLNRQALIEIQSELPQFLSEQGFDIVRGEKGSKATHMRMDDFKREADKQKKALVNEYNALVDKYNLLISAVEEAEKNITIER